MSMRETTEKTRTLRIASRSIVLADRIVAGTVTIEDGHIRGIDEDTVHPLAENWGNDHLIPGLVELHTDHLEPHFSPRPKVHWNPLAAVLSYDAQIATSGITTVFDCLRAGKEDERNAVSDALFTLAAALAEARSRGMLRVDHKLHLRCEICTDNVLDETARFLDTYQTDLMSLMDHSPGQRQYRDVTKLRDYYRGKAQKTEIELDQFIAGRRDAFVRNHDKHRGALLRLAKTHGIALASHDDTDAAQVEWSFAAGMRIAEFPTTVEAAAASHKARIAVIMGAPNVVRGGSHSGSVAAREIAELGYLDVLSSDYVPSSLLYGAVLLADVPAVGGLAGAIRLVTKSPAEAVGLNDRGEITPGRRADLIRVDLTRGVPLVRDVRRGGERVA
jgi:alpha-D-ribose 1-methylphosphonate 5-triphosphate diphosphatase